MLPKVFSFVDIETTGTNPKNSRIIEIGIIRVEDGSIVEEFSSLINPQTFVDPFILTMTGISQTELESAPSFYKIKDKIKELLSGSVFVAHNAIFDYSFIKKEFEHLEESFSSKYCCTVKLSKKLYPRFKHHNLDSIIKRFNLNCTNRHRAFDDTKAMWEFFNFSLQKFGQEKFSLALNNIMKRPSLPIGISENILDTLPESSGVYIFYNKDNTPLYVGKSTNLRDRVMSHFSNSKRETIDMKIAQDITRVETIETAGELGALLLEATLVKKIQPLYNKQLRYASKLLALKKIINSQNYNSVLICDLQEIPVEGLSQILGIFKSKKDLTNFLINLAKEFNLCAKLLGIENTKKSCFNYHLGICKGGCLDKELPIKYNLRFDLAFYKTKIKDWPFTGPIEIKEKSSKEEVFIVDKWCVLGKLQNSSDSLEDISREYLFDSDTYKILNRYLTRKKDFEVFNLSYGHINLS